jgi:lipopolysaccharide assembly protein A
MRIFSLATKVVVFLLLLGFAIKNTDSVTLRYFAGLEWQAPLAFVLLLVLAIGIVAGILTGLGKIASQRRELRALRRELRSRAQGGAGVPVEVA